MCIGWIRAVDPRIAVAFDDTVLQKFMCLALTIRRKGQTKIVVLTALFQQCTNHYNISLQTCNHQRYHSLNNAIAMHTYQSSHTQKCCSKFLNRDNEPILNQSHRLLGRTVLDCQMQGRIVVVSVHCHLHQSKLPWIN
jgi:hypothetical protein